ncbi:hypothetical protein Taro_013810 [Colocasia esculenta]|uniref:Thioredoxin domain-containing protein n=1 Tax=Colocasia esculenta TaxID=4460 RepID=A0A843UH40_COLES|nr:hypothetical protein [Colocasia esculenta]
MAVGLLYLLTLVNWVIASASPPIGVSATSAVCPRPERALLDAALRSQCPSCVERSSPLEVSGEILDKELAHIQNNTFCAVLFYASWCPFSRSSRSIFDALSIMFPQIRHFVVEESSALPSLFSRYGVHSFPSILIVDGETRVRYHGSKDTKSLILFYREMTGLHPAVDFSVYQHVESANQGSVWLWDSTPNEIFARAPYLAFSFLFLCLRAFLYFSPEILSRLEVVWFSYVWHVNWHIFGEWSQLLERALHIIDVKRLCNKLRLSNKTNFHGGANNARVWASSLTSVSLGESSSSRSAQLDS